MIRRFTVPAFGLTFALLATACSFAPDYVRPDTPAADAYKESTAATATKDGPTWQPAQPEAAATPRGPWWESYHDPVLNDLETKVTAANHNLKIAVARYDEARNAADATFADLFPTVGAIAGYGRASTVVPAGATTSQAALDSSASGTTLRNKERVVGAQLSYEVDVWGRVRNAVEASSDEAEATGADLATVDLSLHTELASDYFALRGADDAQAILDKTIVAYQKAYDLTRRRFEGGVASAADVDQAKTQLENAKTQASERQLQRAQLEHAIAVLTGQAPANFALAKAPFGSAPITVDSGLPSALLERRPDIAAAALRTQSANAEIGVARAAYFPTFNLTGTAGYESTVASALFNSSSFFWSLGSSAAVTIFDAGRISALTDEAKAAYEESAASYRQTVLTAYQQVEDNLAAERLLAQEHTSQTAATDAAKRALAQANNRYTGGIVTYLEVVVAQNNSLTAELASNDLRTRRMLSNIQLIKSLGGGWQPVKAN